MSRHQKGKTNLDFTEARESEWQWHQLGHMQVCTSLQTDNHASTSPLSFLQAGCPSCHPTNSVKALKAIFLPTRWRQKSTGIDINVSLPPYVCTGAMQSCRGCTGTDRPLGGSKARCASSPSRRFGVGAGCSVDWTRRATLVRPRRRTQHTSC